MFSDYQASVLREYHYRRGINDLLFELIHPTPGRLRDACQKTCETRFRRQDEKILSHFFNAQVNEADYRRAIRKSDLNIFKPLSNLLQGKNVGTDEKNVELLAWLIDYHPRPYQLEQEYPLRPDEEIVPPAGTTQDPPVTGPEGPDKHVAIITGSILCLLLMLVLTGWWLRPKRFANELHLLPLTGKEQCMFWNNDHYQPVNCAQQLPDTLTSYALIPEKVRRFKKVTNWDTVTERSVGRLYYSKIQGKIELFTDSGYHPVERKRRLLLFSDWIWRHHILPAQIRNSEQTMLHRVVKYITAQ